MQATIFKSAETVHLHLLTLLRYFDDAIRCALSADLKMVAGNRPFLKVIEKKGELMKYKIVRFKVAHRSVYALQIIRRDQLTFTG